MKIEFKKIFAWACLFGAIILLIIGLNKWLFSSIINVSSTTKSLVFDLKDSINEALFIHTNQLEKIEELSQIALQKEKNDLIILNLQHQISQLQTLLNINKKPEIPNIFLIKAYSYTNMGQYTQMWLKSDEFSAQKDKIYGLVRNGFVAGIAFLQDGMLLGALNGAPNTSYGVYIGESKSIGILKNNLQNSVVIEYINGDINIGDEVVTNGLDSIFFEGLKVGVVTSVRQEYSYIVADIDLYHKNNDIGYFWLIDK